MFRGRETYQKLSVGAPVFVLLHVKRYRGFISTFLLGALTPLLLALMMLFGGT